MDEDYLLDQLEKLLKGLEGKEVFRGRRKVPSSGRTRPTEPYLIFEQLVGLMLNGLSGDSDLVEREPHGGGQFPDWSIGNLLVEVKSSNSRNKRFMVGAVKKMAEAFLAGDPKYLKAHYVVFYYTLLPNNYLRIDEISIGRIWNYSKPTAARSGRRPQWPSSRVGTLSAETWADCYFENTPKRGYPVSRKAIDAVLRKVVPQPRAKRLTGATVVADEGMLRSAI